VPAGGAIHGWSNLYPCVGTRHHHQLAPHAVNRAESASCDRPTADRDDELREPAWPVSSVSVGNVPLCNVYRRHGPHSRRQGWVGWRIKPSQRGRSAGLVVRTRIGHNVRKYGTGVKHFHHHIVGDHPPRDRDLPGVAQELA
jgi:hypothetical protein